MRLPYGRRLVVYRRPRWHWPRWVRCGSVCLLWLGPWLVAAYTGRVSWADLDAKIEREHQRRQG